MSTIGKNVEEKKKKQNIFLAYTQLRNAMKEIDM